MTLDFDTVELNETGAGDILNRLAGGIGHQVKVIFFHCGAPEIEKMGITTGLRRKAENQSPFPESGHTCIQPMDTALHRCE